LLLGRRWITLDGMKFALLGVDIDSLRLAEAAIAAGHEIAAAAEMADAPSTARVWPGAAAPEDSQAWEAVLDPDTADALIIGHDAGNEETRSRTSIRSWSRP
jgi:hypothetical protein